MKNKRPLPHRLQYETWLEWNNLDLDGKIFNWVVSPICVFLEWCMIWWPHKCFIMDDQCGKPEHRFCPYCRKLKPNQETTPWM